MPDITPVPENPLQETTAEKPTASDAAGKSVEEIGGREGPDPTRYGDWVKKGIAIDF